MLKGYFHIVIAVNVPACASVQERGGNGEEELGRLPPHLGGRGPVCLRQRAELPATLLHVHHQLHTGAAAGRKAVLTLVIHNILYGLRSFLQPVI